MKRLESCDYFVKVDCDSDLRGRNVGCDCRRKRERIDELVGKRCRLLVHERHRILVPQPRWRRLGPGGHGLHAGNLKPTAIEGAHECRAYYGPPHSGIGAGHEDTAVTRSIHVRRTVLLTRESWLCGGQNHASLSNCSHSLRGSAPASNSL